MTNRFEKVHKIFIDEIADIAQHIWLFHITQFHKSVPQVTIMNNGCAGIARACVPTIMRRPYGTQRRHIKKSS